ncbi:MAG: hypothetical protein WBK20_06970 [Spirochaetota bacterium]|jgi:hypothetical protein
MKRYDSTPNRLSYTSGKYSPPAKRYTSYHIIPCIILAIVLAITLFIYRSCNNNHIHQTTATQHLEQTSKSPNNAKTHREILPKKQNIPVDTIPKDSLPPETDLRILTDK